MNPLFSPAHEAIHSKRGISKHSFTLMYGCTLGEGRGPVNPLTAKYLHGGHFSLGGRVSAGRAFMTHKTLQLLHPCQHFSIYAQ